MATILMQFPCDADSPTGRASVRIRYTLERDAAGNAFPMLRYAKGTRELTRDAWQGFRQSGAIITVSDDRGRSVVRQVLGLDAIP